MRITILVDNRAGPGLVAEHGLSLWIESEHELILFDTGQGGALAPNARAGVHVDTTDILVIRHGHYDHTGAIAQVLQLVPNVDLYCHPGVMQPRYSVRNGKSKSIQMPRESAAAIQEHPVERLHWILQPTRLSTNIGLTGPIPRKNDYEDTGGPFFFDQEGRRADPIDDRSRALDSRR